MAGHLVLVYVHFHLQDTASDPAASTKERKKKRETQTQRKILVCGIFRLFGLKVGSHRAIFVINVA